MGAVWQLLAKHNVQVRRGAADNHRQRGIVERFNRTLAERLFGHQYAQEMLLAARGSSVRSIEWVTRLPAVVAALNGEVTRLTCKKPSEAIKACLYGLRRWHKSPPPLFLAGPLASVSRRFFQVLTFAICTSRVNSRAVVAAQLTLYGP